MAFAKHNNTDVSYANQVGVPAHPLLLGEFKEADYGNYFHYAERPYDGTEFALDCPHIVYVGDTYRIAKVLKTVAWICTDEADDGQPIFQKWNLKNHRNYDTSWVHA